MGLLIQTNAANTIKCTVTSCSHVFSTWSIRVFDAAFASTKRSQQRIYCSNSYSIFFFLFFRKRLPYQTGSTIEVEIKTWCMSESSRRRDRVQPNNLEVCDVAGQSWTAVGIRQVGALLVMNVRQFPPHVQDGQRTIFCKMIYEKIYNIINTTLGKDQSLQ